MKLRVAGLSPTSCCSPERPRRSGTSTGPGITTITGTTTATMVMATVTNAATITATTAPPASTVAGTIIVTGTEGGAQEPGRRHPTVQAASRHPQARLAVW
ncbi:hypothetical protein MEX01_51360 [Methylorubrum extorquens]|nr:hypothetical protein MEX01_51360 [Methylorubrum extorquens]